MRPMIVVMVDPDADRFAALALGVESVGVEAFLGEDPLVALDFPVVPGRVRPGPLMPRRMRVHGAHERLRAVVGAVVGAHPDQAIDAVRSEESPGPGEETDGGRGGLVLEGFGVGEAGVAIDCGVQVGVAHALLALLRVAAAVESPASTGGDLSDLLHVQVDHVTREAGDDLPGLAVVLTGRVEVSAAGDPEALQPAPDGADAVMVAATGELECDAAGRPLLFSPPGVDEFEDLDRWPRRMSGRSAGPVFQRFGTVVAVAVHPLRQSRAGDAGFGGDMRDRSAIIFDTLDQAESSGRGQRRITVGHGTGLFQQMDGFSTTHRAGQGPVPSSPPR